MRGVIVAALLIACPLAFADESSRPAKRVADAKGTGKRITQLRLPDDFEARSEPFGDESRTLVVFEGTYPRTLWTLMWKDKPIVLGADGKFSFAVPVSANATTIDLLAISETGEVERESVGIFFPAWKEFRAVAKAKPPKRTITLVGLGPSLLFYRQTGIPDVTSLLLSAKISFLYLLLPPSWDVGASGYITLLPLSVSPSDYGMRFMGLNLRFGYALPQIKDPWRLSVLGGLYYTTTFVSGTRSLGFQDLTGPQIFPTIRRTFRNKDVATGYLKYSPIANGGSVMSLANRELAAGVSWVRPMASGHSIGASMDMADLLFKVSSTEIHSTTISLGIAYGF